MQRFLSIMLPNCSCHHACIEFKRNAFINILFYEIISQNKYNGCVFSEKNCTCRIKSNINNKQNLINLSRIYGNKYCSTHTRNNKGIEWRGVVRGIVPLGLCLIAVMQWRAFRRYSTTSQAKPWQIKLYCALPLRAMSRVWGKIAEQQIPVILRPTLLGFYASTFGVNLQEAEYSDLRSYPSLADFFARGLKEGARPQDDAALTAPCDGTVLYCGRVTSDYLDQVKGVTYSLDEFVGDPEITITDYRSTLIQNKTSNTLYQCILYLAPGDYHRFHSPCEWQPHVRRHVSGRLLSVSPKIASWLPNLFCLNERVIYLGRWLHGFFSMAAVGATNVGSVQIYMDPALSTNCAHVKCGCIDEIALPIDSHLKKGAPLGEFRMGSTIVLVFEAPKNFRFSLYAGEKVRVGQALGAAHVTYVDRVRDTHSQKFQDVSVK